MPAYYRQVLEHHVYAEEYSQEYERNIKDLHNARHYFDTLSKLCKLWSKRDVGTKWQRMSTVSYSNGQLTLRLKLAAEDNMKYQILPFLEVFAEYLSYHSEYITKTNKDLDVYYNLPDDISLHIEVKIHDSRRCRLVPTGKMVPETKYECF